MRVEPVEIYSDKTNRAVLRHPGRKFPGLLIQGDSLYTLCRLADEALRLTGESEPSYAWLNQLRKALRSRLANYKSVLTEHGIRLPFVEQDC